MKIAAIVCLLIGGLVLVIPLLNRELLPDESLARVALFECMSRTKTEEEVQLARMTIGLYLRGGSIATALPLRFTYSRMGKEIRVGKILVASDHLLYGVKVRNCKKAETWFEKNK